jgi:hypothetical protein
VNHVALLGVVLRLQTARLVQPVENPDLFSLSKILGLRPCMIMPLARSTWSMDVRRLPSLRGCGICHKTPGISCW